MLCIFIDKYLCDFLFYFNDYSQLFLRLTDGGLLRGFAFVNAATGEDEVVQSIPMAFDQRKFVVLDQDNAGAVSHDKSPCSVGCNAPLNLAKHITCFVYIVLNLFNQRIHRIKLQLIADSGDEFQL